MTETCVMSRLITKESNRRANEGKKEAWQTKGNIIRLVEKKEYKMDYLQLKRMTEDKIEWRHKHGPAQWQNTQGRRI